MRQVVAARLPRCFIPQPLEPMRVLQMEGGQRPLGEHHNDEHLKYLGPQDSLG